MRLRVLVPQIALVLGATAGGIALTSGGSGPARGHRATCVRSTESAPGRATSPLYDGPVTAETGCARPGGPESFSDLARANSSRATRSLAPGTALKPGAYRSAVASAASLRAVGARWQPLGDTPIVGNNPDYDTTGGSTRQGLPGLAGRTTSIVADSKGNLYAAASNGGIWRSTDRAQTWSSIGDGLPTQVASNVAWTSAGGGRVIALTGDDAFGGDSVPGLGVYTTDDNGKHWRHSTGVPDGVLGFKLAVDPADPDKVYAATGGGLFRSTDGGRSFTNTNLPTGKGATPDCTGKAPTVKDCFLANMVTDVVVQAKGGPGATKGGAVLAAVGWRAGDKPNTDGSIQSPGNGIYVSPTGAPGSFKNMDMAANATPVPPFGNDPLTQSRIGRIELGIANGAKQDHRIVYAVVEDAVKFNGGVAGLDAHENGATSAAQSDVLNGIWVSTDFGASWKQLEGSSAIDSDPSSGSALAPPTCKAPAVVAYCPGVQAWYNQWIQPDPTQQTASGVPTRLVFGLEELWTNTAGATPPTGLDGSSSLKFSVIGRYYADEACTLLTATNGLPFCPAAPGGATTKTTTHPDQHGGLFLPDADGKSATLFAGNDGGVFSQHAESGADFSQANWGNGNSKGMHTLQPYDAAMAKDGTVYMGLQDNGEGKIEPSGKSYTVFGGDAFFSAVDPDDSNVAYEEYVYGAMSATADGGKTWTSLSPQVTSGLFSTPFQMDPADARHLIIGGRDILETTDGASFTTVYDLGTQQHRGDAAASAGDTDPDNQTSAIDVIGTPPPKTPRTGPPTKDISYTGGAATVPGPGNDVTGVDSPASSDDHEFTIGPNDGDNLLRVDVSWDDPTGSSDWDLYLYKKAADGTLTPAGSSVSGSNPEVVTLSHPDSGDYLIRVYNYTASGTFDAKVTFKGPESSAGGGQGYPSAAYVGFCGFCDVITQGLPFANGIATNVGGDKPGKTAAADGWHIAGAKGLPVRYITSVRIDPGDPKTVYATLGGYGRKWAAPGALGDDTSKVGKGHVYKSTDAGETFTDISANLPDVPANWSLIHNGHLVVATDLGVFESCDTSGGRFVRLGRGLPRSPVMTLRQKPGDPDFLVASTFGRGVYTYKFPSDTLRCGKRPPSGCSASVAKRLANATPVAGRKRIRLTIPKSRAGQTVDVFQVSSGRRIFRERLVARFRGRKAPFAWNGRANRPGRRVTDGYYFVRVRAGKAGISRLVLVRRGGKWSRQPDFYLTGTCGSIAFAKFERPVFGGAQGYPLRFAYRLGAGAKTRLIVKRGGKTILDAKDTVRARKTVRAVVMRPARKKGLYSATLRVTRKGKTVTARLYSRRI